MMSSDPCWRALSVVFAFVAIGCNDNDSISSTNDETGSDTETGDGDGDGDGEGDGDGDGDASTVLLAIDVPDDGSTKAAVTIDGEVHYTDSAGYLLLDNLAGDEIVARVEMPGRAPHFVSIDLRADVDFYREVELYAYGEPVQIDASADEPVSVEIDGVTVTFPPGSLVNAQNEPVEGLVGVTLIHHDPTEGSTSAQPAGMSGKMDINQDIPYRLESLGMLEVSAWQNGAKLHLAAGQTAQVQMVVPNLLIGGLSPGLDVTPDQSASGDGLKPRELTVGLEVPDWWLDDVNGHWELRDNGTLIEVGNQLVWSVGIHELGWHNADILVPVEQLECYVIVARDDNDQFVSHAFDLVADGDGRRIDQGFTATDFNAGSNCVDVRVGVDPTLLFPYAQVTAMPLSSTGVAGTCDVDGMPNQACGVIEVVVPTELVCEPNEIIECAYGGEPPETDGVGACEAATQYCIAGGTVLTECLGEWTPEQETCATDYDDDCDGEVNEPDGLECGGDECGDGVVTGIEECDDGNTDNTDTCVEGCVAAQCGDGYVGPGEGCDDGNTVDDDACTNACALPTCGDGQVQMGEGCDDDNADNTDDCLDTCVSSSCGDGFVWAGIEECDDANADDTDSCVQGCVAASCGDGFVGPGEGCDDGNMVDDDACTSACVLPTCGDGMLQMGEDCDDGWANNTDGCLDTCVAASCGDGFVWAGMEACDDGNGNDDDACLQGCVHSSCGDGFVWAGMEVCDDGNLVDGDGCNNPCGSPDAVAIAAGFLHNCVLLVGGGVRCWGSGEHGRLGYGNTENIGDDETPASVGDIDVGGPVTQLALGEYHTCALLDGGAVRCWGSGEYGALGYGNTENIGDDETPASAGDIDVGGLAVQIAVGDWYTCAVLDDGAVRCWGWGGWGVIGSGNDGDIGDDETPGSVGAVDVGGPAAQVAIYRYHTCVVLESGAARCWGLGDYGRLGYGNTNNIGYFDPPLLDGLADIGVGGTVDQISLGANHTCALLDSGAVRCWGRGEEGELGYANTADIGDDEIPSSVGPVDIGGDVVQLALGATHACAVLDDGAVRCWGRDIYSALGYGDVGNIGDDETPASMGDLDVGGTAVQVATGAWHVCALLDGPIVRCWGYGEVGQLGYGHMEYYIETPADAGAVSY